MGLRHLKQYTTLFAAFATTSKSEIVLLNKIQEYCYENMNFLKSFNKIVLLLCKTEIVDASQEFLIRPTDRNRILYKTWKKVKTLISFSFRLKIVSPQSTKKICFLSA